MGKRSARLARHELALCLQNPLCFVHVLTSTHLRLVPQCPQPTSVESKHVFLRLREGHGNGAEISSHRLARQGTEARGC